MVTATPSRSERRTQPTTKDQGHAHSPGSSSAGTEAINPGFGAAIRTASKKAQQMEPWCPALGGAGPSRLLKLLIDRLEDLRQFDSPHQCCEQPNDNLRAVTTHPKSSRPMNSPGRPTPASSLTDDRSSVRESLGPKGKGKSKGQTGKGDKRGYKGKGKGKGVKGDRTPSPPAQHDDQRFRR